jgi:hypothetical protein
MSGQNQSDPSYISEVSSCEDVPIIDLGCEDRTQIVKQIGDACKSYGFFQVQYHANNSLSFLDMQFVRYVYHVFVCVCLGDQSRRVFGGSGKDVRGGS